MATDPQLRELDLRLSDGRNLHVYDRMPIDRRSAAAGADQSGATGTDGPGATDAGRRRVEPFAVFWHHGTPNLGAPPEPLFAAADRLGVRWVAFDRPGYGRSTPAPGRTAASVAADLAAVADALDIERFALLGHSGGATHALACAAALPERVVAAAGLAGLAPHGAADLDWFAGMIPSGEASLRAATRGRQAKRAYQESEDEYDPEFTATDLATLDGPWSWLMTVVGPALDAGPDGLVDDDIAYVSDWGCDPTRIAAPVLLLYGEQDGIVPVAHGRWLGRHCPGARLRTFPGDGHISILTHGEEALEWLAEQRLGEHP